MVSFFGLKFGDKKKKSEGKSAQAKQPQQWKRIDQNALGEGQFFGQNIHQKGVINGSIRSVSRAGTPQAGGSWSPYAVRDTHNLAAASMFDLSTAPAYRGSQTSLQLKPHASDINLRTRFGRTNGSSTSLGIPAPGFASRFGANNGSSTSLAAPAPGFGSRLGANNGSSTSLAAPAPGFGSRPGTPNRTKPWVNPLDVHFMRSVPSGPPTPKSPLAASPMQLPPTPTTEAAETGSIFGEDADDMVSAVMASVKKREEEEKLAREREKELEKQRETARLEMERLERQKSTESNLSGRRPSVPQALPELHEQLATAPSLPPSQSREEAGPWPGSRGCPMRAHAVHQGPPPTGPPTQCLPQPPGQGPPRQGPLGPAESPPGRGPRPPGPATSGPGQRANGPGSHAASPQASPRKPVRPHRPPPLQESGQLGSVQDALRSPSPPLSTPGVEDGRSHSPALRRLPSTERRPSLVRPNAQASGNGRSTPGPETHPLISTLTSPSTVTSPSGSLRRLSLEDEPVEQFARPIIQNVSARRDTFALGTPRQQSLSMKIEELEKTLLHAQQTHQKGAVRTSTSSSCYDDGNDDEEDEEDDDGPILSIQPAPLRLQPAAAPPAAPLVAAPGAATAAAVADRPQSPFRGPPRRGPLPRRPALDEYGVSSNHVALRARGGTPTPASRSGSTDNYSSHSSPPSRTSTPQLRHPNWKRDLSQPSPAPTLDTSERPRPSPVIDTGFKFDFGPNPTAAAPPTPDSASWPLASPTTETSTTLPPPSSSLLPPASEQPPAQVVEPTETEEAPPSATAAPKFTRAHVPPPLNLKFNFSPDAPSRDPSLWTPQPPQPPRLTPSTADERPSTSAGPSTSTSTGTGTGTGNGNGNGNVLHNVTDGKQRKSGLAASPRLISQLAPPDHPSALSDPSDPAELYGRGRGRGVGDEQDDDPAAFMGIGMARGPSIREVRRPPRMAGARGRGRPRLPAVLPAPSAAGSASSTGTAAGPPAGNGGGTGTGTGTGTGMAAGVGMVDSFGTGFI